jgi:HEAT repeat protein
MVNGTNFHDACVAVSASSCIGSTALPVLLTALTNRQSQIRFMAVMTLSFPQMRSERARGAVAPLLECLKDKDTRLAEAAAYTLGEMKFEPETVIPAMTNCLARPGLQGPLGPIRALEAYGTNARSAVPALVPLLNDRNADTRYAATNALWKIAPEFAPPANPLRALE